MSSTNKRNEPSNSLPVAATAAVSVAAPAVAPSAPVLTPIGHYVSDPKNGFVGEVNEPDLPADRRFEPSNTFRVCRRESTRIWDLVIFVRKDLVSLEQEVMSQFWQKDNKVTLYVRGPPGSGMTCFFYLWARLRSVEEHKSVLVIQFRENGTCHIWIRVAGGALWRLGEAIEKDKLKSRVDEILNAGVRFDLCIHDGVIQGKDICTSMISKLNTAVANGLIGKVAHITSLAFSLSTGGQRLDPDGDIVRLSLDSWSFEDYEEAVKSRGFADSIEAMLTADAAYVAKLEGVSAADTNPDFAAGEEEKVSIDDEIQSSKRVDEQDMAVDNVEKVEPFKAVLETKYFFAGGSARFMFDYPLSSLRSELDVRCQVVHDSEWKHFAQGSVATGTPSAVNTLMQQFKLNASPVSKYIMFRAYEKCKTDLVNAVKAAARHSGNPALKGWAFELEQIDLIRLSLEAPEQNPEYITNGVGLSFSPGSYLEYDEETLTDEAIDLSGAVIWCMKWNQGCFDVAFIHGEALVTVQFTVSEEHSLKPNFIRKLRDALIDRGVMEKDCLHVGIADRAVKTFQFKLGTAGTGRQHNPDDEPQFTIFAHHSPPLVKKSGTTTFQAQFSSPALKEVRMWQLGMGKRDAVANKKARTA